MCVGHAVHAVCHTCQRHDPKLQMSYAPCPNCTHQHPPSRHNCPAQELACKGCGKRVTGEQNATPLAPLVYKCPIINPSSKVCQSQNREKTPAQRPVHCCNGLWNSRRCAPKGDDH